MKITVYGAGRVVTGSCYSLEVGDSKILIDCGMFQGSKEVNKLNYEPLGFDPKEYKALILTHAHLDHCGRIPLLMKYGFKGTIFSTEPTKELSKIVMLDAANIQENDTKHENKRRARDGLPERTPLFTEGDAKAAFDIFETMPYHKKTQVTPEITVEVFDSGHILGSGSLKLHIDDNGTKKSIIFSGDIGQFGAPIVEDPEAITGSDYLFIESTYGDRLHPPISSRRHELLKAIEETVQKKGKILIPTFAIERTQELLYDLDVLYEKNLVPHIPVYLDSPMAVKATEIYKKFPEFYEEPLRELIRNGENPFHFPNLKYSIRVEESMAINAMKGPIIIMAGSGMCTAGRIKHHIKHEIGHENNAIIFVGYQSPGSLGFHIKRGEKTVRLLGKQIPVKAKVYSIDSFSGHADYNGLLTWFDRILPQPKKVFVTHGDEESAKAFVQKLQDNGVDAHDPYIGEEIEL